MRFATLRMRSIEPTDVPPYFWTISATLSRQRAKRDRGVGAAEAERIRNGDADAHRTRDAWHEIEIAGWIDIDEVRGRRRNLVAHRQDGEHRLDPGRSAQQVSGHRLRRRNRELAGV